MADSTVKIRYPRRRPIRVLIRLVGYFLVWLLCRLTIRGRENLPESGPLILIGNHVDALDGILLSLYTPYLAETMIAADLPFPAYIQTVLDLYGYIPVHRGSRDRKATRLALQVLQQGGAVILFPEGGVWRAPGKSYHTGVAWLSQKSQATVVPVGLGGTKGAFARAFQFKRPALEMTIGQPLDPVPADTGYDRAALQRYADAMMAAVLDLAPPDNQQDVVPVEAMDFSFSVTLSDETGQAVETRTLPEAQSVALGMLYYDLTLLKTLRDNLNLPVEAILTVNQAQDAAAVETGVAAVLAHVEQDNPEFFSYRFGSDRATHIQQGYETLQQMAQDALQQGYRMTLSPAARLPETGNTTQQSPVPGD